jgi:hypothetical protein
MEDIQREIALFQEEHRMLVAHIDYTDLWAINLGRWRAAILNSKAYSAQNIFPILLSRLGSGARRLQASILYHCRPSSRSLIPIAFA